MCDGLAELTCFLLGDWDLDVDVVDSEKDGVVVHLLSLEQQW